MKKYLMMAAVAVMAVMATNVSAQSLNGSINAGLAVVNQQSLSQGSIGGGSIGVGLNPSGSSSIIHSSTSQGLGGNLTSFNARTGELKTVSEHNLAGSSSIKTSGTGSIGGSIGGSTFGGSSMGSSSVVGVIGGVGLKTNW